LYADATVPVLRSTSDAVSRLYEAEIRSLVAVRVVELTPVQRNLVTAFQEECRRLVTQLRGYQDQLEGVRTELATAGFWTRRRAADTRPDARVRGWAWVG
jgi:hypothetical protein